MNPNIRVEITDIADFHCFRLTLNRMAQTGDENAHRIEIMLHATGLVDLIHKCSLTLCEWQRQTSEVLLQQMTGMTVEEMRAKGIVSSP